MCNDARIDALPPLITTNVGIATSLDVHADAAVSAHLALEGGGARDLTLQPEQGRLCVPPIAETGLPSPACRRSGNDPCGGAGHAAGRSTMSCRMRAFGALRRRSTRCASRATAGSAMPRGVAALADVAGRRGADALALSPLHALFPADPARFGPYSPSSRLFLNPLHAAPSWCSVRSSGAACDRKPGSRMSSRDWKRCR